MPYAVIHDTFEKNQKMPVVRHIFFAPTKKKAEAFFRAHMKADKFMRQCTTKGNFEGQFKCRVKIRIQKV